MNALAQTLRWPRTRVDKQIGGLRFALWNLSLIHI